MKGEIPVLQVEGETVPEVWEKSVKEIWEKRFRIKADYDKPEDPLSKDCTMILVISNPDSQPRLHKGLPGGLKDVGSYREEVVEGIRDFHVGEGGWHYTYHERLRNYVPKKRDFPKEIAKTLKKKGIEKDKIEKNYDLILEIEEELRNEGNDQIEYMVNKLSREPHSRRVQATTWIPDVDQKSDDPPCLQRIWARLGEDEDGNKYLNVNTHWRSRDAYKAALMNIDAFIEIQKRMRKKLSEKMEEEIKLGRYVDISDSYHIYGSYFDEFEKRFLNLLESRKEFENRVINTEEKMYKSLIERGKEEIREKIKEEKISRVERAMDEKNL